MKRENLIAEIRSILYRNDGIVIMQRDNDLWISKNGDDHRPFLEVYDFNAKFITAGIERREFPLEELTEHELFNLLNYFKDNFWYFKKK